MDINTSNRQDRISALHRNDEGETCNNRQWPARVSHAYRVLADKHTHTENECLFLTDGLEHKVARFHIFTATKMKNDCGMSSFSSENVPQIYKKNMYIFVYQALRFSFF